MKIAMKFTLALIAGVSTVHAASAVMRVRREAELFQRDVAHDEKLVGRAVSHAVARTWQTRGQQKALDLIEHVGEREAGIDIRWVWLDAGEDEPQFMPRAEGWMLEPIDTEPFALRIGDGGALVTYVPVTVPEPRRGAIEIYDDLVDEHAYLRESIYNTAVAFVIMVGLCAVVALVLGVWLIGRPVRLLVEQARRIGTGNFASTRLFTSNDEMGQIAREMTEMCHNLAELQARVDGEHRARLDALEQLRHADRLRTVGVLASGVAHELGTPINIVEGHAELILEDESASAPVRESATIIGGQCARMTSIIRQLLDFARRGGPSLSSVSLHDVGLQTVKMLDPLARKRQVELVFEDHEGDIIANIGFEPMQQALTNVVVNALHASSPGDRVVIRIERTSTYACIVVEDSGAGMDEDTRNRVFEPFFTTKDVGDGTGLGLSVAYGIIEDHGGAIHVSSEPGQGARFSICVPVNHS